MEVATVSYTRAVDVLLLLSNLFLLLPAYVSYRYNLYTRALIIFLEAWGSFFYHSCDSYNVCIGLPFSLWHIVDFSLATWLIWQAGLYLIDWKPRWRFLERWLLLLGLFFIIILVAAFPESQIPILAIAAFVFLIAAIYWLFYAYYAFSSKLEHKLPNYNWNYFVLGVSVLGASTMLFTVQTMVPEGYFGIHSLWHTLAAFGLTWLILIKDPPLWFQTADRRISKSVGLIHPVRVIQPKRGGLVRRKQ